MSVDKDPSSTIKSGETYRITNYQSIQMGSNPRDYSLFSASGDTVVGQKGDFNDPSLRQRWRVTFKNKTPGPWQCKLHPISGSKHISLGVTGVTPDTDSQGTPHLGDIRDQGHWQSWDIWPVEGTSTFRICLTNTNLSLQLVDPTSATSPIHLVESGSSTWYFHKAHL